MDNEAIEILKVSKLPSEMMSSLWSDPQKNVYPPGSTCQDYINYNISKELNETYSYYNEETKSPEIYKVSLLNHKAQGYFWEIDIANRSVRFINDDEYLKKIYGITGYKETDDFTLTNPKSEGLKIRQWKSLSENKPVIIYEYKGEIINNTDVVITKANIFGEIVLIYKEKSIKGDHWFSNTGFDKDVNQQNPWKPQESRSFTIRTEGVEKIYENYLPEYAEFEIYLQAEDPIGYTFSQAIYLKDIKEEWKFHFKLKNN